MYRRELASSFILFRGRYHVCRGRSGSKIERELPSIQPRRRGGLRTAYMPKSRCSLEVLMQCPAQVSVSS